MTDIIEAAARALECLPGDDELHRNLGTRVLAAVTPLIRAAALEEAAKVAEDYDRDGAFAWMARDIAAAIRALKEQP